MSVTLLCIIKVCWWSSFSFKTYFSVASLSLTTCVVVSLWILAVEGVLTSVSVPVGTISVNTQKKADWRLDPQAAASKVCEKTVGWAFLSASSVVNSEGTGIWELFVCYGSRSFDGWECEPCWLSEPSDKRVCPLGSYLKSQGARWDHKRSRHWPGVSQRISGHSLPLACLQGVLRQVPKCDLN